MKVNIYGTRCHILEDVLPSEEKKSLAIKPVVFFSVVRTRVLQMIPSKQLSSQIVINILAGISHPALRYNYHVHLWMGGMKKEEEGPLI